MNIGILLPSAFMYEPLSHGKIFAPKQLAVDLANDLVRRGHRVRMYAALSQDETQADVISGNIGLITSEPYAMKLRYTNERTRQSIARLQARWEYEMDLSAHAYKDAREGRIDIIHSFLEFGSHYMAEATGIPTVYTVHDPMPDKKYLDYLRYQRFPTDRYVAISQAQAQALRDVVTVVGVVYNGIDISQYSLTEEAGEYLLFVGRYMPEKGVSDVLEAAKATNIQTILAGSKEYRELPYFQTHIAPAEKVGNIRDIGFVTGRKKVGLFGSAKALLLPIHWDEPFGMVMTEAMACGTPVIAYNRGSVSEVVKDGVTGFIVDPPESDIQLPQHAAQRGTWSIKLSGVPGLIEAIQRIGEIDRAACRAHVVEHFSTSQMVSGYERVYESVLQK